eukprot:252971-Lingulodinium_polyedra.AAC.1
MAYRPSDPATAMLWSCRKPPPPSRLSTCVPCSKPRTWVSKLLRLGVLKFTTRASWAWPLTAPWRLS